jgi:hypothetical protein
MVMHSQVVKRGVGARTLVRDVPDAVILVDDAVVVVIVVIVGVVVIVVVVVAWSAGYGSCGCKCL